MVVWDISPSGARNLYNSIKHYAGRPVSDPHFAVLVTLKKNFVQICSSKLHQAVQ